MAPLAPEEHCMAMGALKEDLVLAMVLQSCAKKPTPIVNTAVNNLSQLLLI